MNAKRETGREVEAREVASEGEWIKGEEAELRDRAIETLSSFVVILIEASRYATKDLNRLSITMLTRMNLILILRLIERCRLLPIF